ncbi:hypothetical protein HQ29_07415 [Porphyromonas canoris]|uniref:hypothetical protein n=1 Tax=Porphyromonas canoris TaxID=36875 RepID=UPI00051DF7B4|nr:hypothetical protein [Porphyromonas canoris]KGL51795.1 hypothetical protein HQ29_07415 [Porphyromonas canoris]
MENTTWSEAKRNASVEIFQPNRRLDLGVAQAPHYLCKEKETASICYAISGTEDEEAEVQR